VGAYLLSRFLAHGAGLQPGVGAKTGKRLCVTGVNQEDMFPG
jgi:hypothetical protein